MRNLVYHIATSLDGYIAAADGSVDRFLMQGPHADDFVASLAEYDTVIMGARTYSFGFQFGLKAGQAAYPGLKHVIVSRSLSFTPNDEVALLADDVPASIRCMKEQAGKPIWLCGGGVLATLLAEHGLIDELRLKVNPIVLGTGTPLFGTLARPPLLQQSAPVKSYPNGVTLLTYRWDAGGS